MLKTSNKRISIISIGAVFVLFAAACRLSTLSTPVIIEPGAWMWNERFFNLPPSIHVYEGTSQGAGGQNFRAWRVDVDFSDRTLKAQPFVTDSPSGRESPSTQAQHVGALVAVNGGYFDMDGVPAKTYSLVMRDGRVLCPNVNRVRRGRREYFVARSAFGITRNHKFDISWIVHDGDRVLALKRPFSQVVGEGETPVVENAREWKVQNAIGGGPRLLENGRENITYNEEVFFGSGFPSDENYSRCAVGYKPNGTMVFLVTDRMDPRISAGLTLHGTAQTLLQLGCKDAMNLDGGGSETLVVNGRVLNQPSDGQERPTTSIFAILRDAAPPPAPVMKPASASKLKSSRAQQR
jgi:hypothetical protein